MAGGSSPGVPEQIADEALVEQAQRGDRSAFEELVRRHADRLYAVLLRFTGRPDDAEEASQEAFLRAWRRIGSFHGHSQFFTWLYRIGINEAKRRADRAPSPGREVSLEEDAFESIGDTRPQPHDSAELGELRVALEQAISDLDPAYRAPLVLRDIEGLSTREAAAAMDLSEAAFKSRLHRARMAVREQVAESRQRFLKTCKDGEPKVVDTGSEVETTMEQMSMNPWKRRWRRTNMMRDHRWAEPRLSELLDGELRPRSERRAREHASICPECGRIQRQLRSLIAGLRGLQPRHDVDGEIGPRIAGRVAERLDEEPDDLEVRDE